MKVMWVCNTANQDVYRYKGKGYVTGGGWLTGLSESLKSISELELVYCYPSTNSGVQDDFVYDGVHYYSFFSPLQYPILNKLGVSSPQKQKESKLQNEQLEHILSVEKPDIVHIFGTEFYHSHAIADIAEGKSKLVCSIQGLTYYIAEHYLSLIPSEEYNKINVSSIFRGTLKQQCRKLEKRGKDEIYTINKCGNIIGRTTWDRSCTYFINQKRRYFHCDEVLRPEFYNEKQWNFSCCKKHSIFISQASSPLKGFNIVVEAVAILKNEFPDLEVRVAGNNFISKDSILDRLKISTYGVYIRKIIERNKLVNNIHFIGTLNADEMIREYMNCNVFISASSIENSPNSVGEAMVLGVPIISSDVGGIKSLMVEDEEGLYYPADEYYILADKIRTIFLNNLYAKKLGDKARLHAKEIFDSEKNAKRLVEIYKELMK